MSALLDLVKRELQAHASPPPCLCAKCVALRGILPLLEDKPAMPEVHTGPMTIEEAFAFAAKDTSGDVTMQWCRDWREAQRAMKPHVTTKLTPTQVAVLQSELLKKGLPAQFPTSVPTAIRPKRNRELYAGYAFQDDKERKSERSTMREATFWVVLSVAAASIAIGAFVAIETILK